MKIILCLLFIFSMLHYSIGQRKNEVVVKPGNSVAKSIPIRGRYNHDEFKDGYLITEQNKRSKNLKLNFELLTGEPQFIDEKGDTLFLDKHIARQVLIEKTRYLNTTKGYYELISNHPDFKLAVQRGWSIARYETEFTNGIGGKEKNSARDARNAIYSPKFGQMIRNEDTVYERDSSYFFIDAKEKIYKASKSNLVRLFPRHEDKIKNYLDQQTINFKKEEDLIKLSGFCISLLAN